MRDQNYPSTQIAWRITRFASLTERNHFSDIFTVGGTKWKLIIYPKGERSTEHLAVYMEVVGYQSLPSGWSREAMMFLTLVNQFNRSLSKENKYKGWINFNSKTLSWGFYHIIPLSELRDISRGFIVDEAVVLEATVEVRRVHPPIIVTSTLHVAPSEIANSTDRFGTYFASVEEFINGKTTSTIRVNSYSQKNLQLNSITPSFEDIEQAKQSLNECLSDLDKLNIKRLQKALLTLCLAQDELSYDQQKAAILFWANFDDFTLPSTSEQDNSEYELHKLLKDKLFIAIKKNHEQHLLIRQSHNKLCKEEEELKKRLEEIVYERNNLRVEWESLLADSKMLQSNYGIQEEKIVDVDEKKRIAEERMLPSSTTWAKVKGLFGLV